ncbi:hypothetical protein XH98_35755 [Bradyrhizobium sp. CCBAU 51745]|nr:hypothetical protein [Bradyrhizobium sp. CCBAU 51745]
MALGLTRLFGPIGGTQLDISRNHILATGITQILGDETQLGAKKTRIRRIFSDSERRGSRHQALPLDQRLAMAICPLYEIPLLAQTG